MPEDDPTSQKPKVREYMPKPWSGASKWSRRKLGFVGTIIHWFGAGMLDGRIVPLLALLIPVTCFALAIKHGNETLRGVYGFASVGLYTLMLIAMMFSTKWRDESRILLRKYRSLEDIRSLTWMDFELFVAGVLTGGGYRVTMRGGIGGDGGVDVEAIKDGKRFLVQCKHYQVEPVGVELVRGLLGAMTLEGAHGAIFVTSGTYTRAARELELDHTYLKLWDEGDLLVQLSKLPPTDDGDEALPEGIRARVSQLGKEVRAAMPNSVIVPPVCPHCGARTILQSSPKNNERFWACPNYPRCRGKTISLKPDEVAVLDPHRRSGKTAHR